MKNRPNLKNRTHVTQLLNIYISAHIYQLTNLYAIESVVSTQAESIKNTTNLAAHTQKINLALSRAWVYLLVYVCVRIRCIV